MRESYHAHGRRSLHILAALEGVASVSFVYIAFWLLQSASLTFAAILKGNHLEADLANVGGIRFLVAPSYLLSLLVSSGGFHLTH